MAEAIKFVFNDSFKKKWIGYPLGVALYVISWVIGKKGGYRHRFFVERDPTLSYPYKTDTVPPWTLWMFGFIIPLFFVFLVQIIIKVRGNGKYFDRRVKDTHLLIIALISVLAATNLVTNVIKVLVGRLRPNFFAFCDYKGYRSQVESGNITQYLADTIPGQIGDLKYCNLEAPDSHLSFPSGHSSLTFCGMTFLCLYLLQITRRVVFPNSTVRMIIRFAIVLIPLFAGALVAASRVIDYKHNVEDTVWGSLIGIFACGLGYYVNFINKTQQGMQQQSSTELPMTSMEATK